MRRVKALPDDQLLDYIERAREGISFERRHLSEIDRMLDFLGESQDPTVQQARHEAKVTYMRVEANIRDHQLDLDELETEWRSRQA